VYSVHPFVFPSTSIDSGNFCFYDLLRSAWCCARLWARVQSGEPRDSCLPPPLVRSDFFVCFRLPMTEELNASQFLVSIYPRWCFLGWVSVFSTVHGNGTLVPIFFCFQLSNWIMASSNRAHLSLSLHY
jgi:hypothetical protein